MNGLRPLTTPIQPPERIIIQPVHITHHTHTERVIEHERIQQPTRPTTRSTDPVIHIISVPDNTSPRVYPSPQSSDRPPFREDRNVPTEPTRDTANVIDARHRHSPVLEEKNKPSPEAKTIVETIPQTIEGKAKKEIVSQLFEPAKEAQR